MKSAADIDLDALPRTELPVGTTLSRIHRDAFGCWFFDCRRGSAGGRWNPVDSHDDLGACYFGESELCAFIETARDDELIEDAWVEDRSLSRVHLADALVVVDFTKRKALQKGLTQSEVLAADYSWTQAVASRLADDGVDGVRYFSRHDMAAKEIALALFGPAGPADPSTSPWPAAATDAIPQELLNVAADEFEYVFVPSL